MAPGRRGKRQLPELPGLRARVAESQYAAMKGCPPGSVNTVMLKRAAQAADLLDDLAVLDPEEAATMMPAVRCRQFSGTAGLGVWWMRFAAACERRRAAETPALGHLSPPSAAKWLHAAGNGGGAELAQLRALRPAARAVLDWLRAHPDSSEAQIGVGIGTAGIRAYLSELRRAGLIEAIGRDSNITIYRATGEES